MLLPQVRIVLGNYAYFKSQFKVLLYNVSCPSSSVVVLFIFLPHM